MFRKRRRDAELEEELAAHLEMLAEENEARGMAAEEARRAARVELGGAEQIKEAVRERRGVPWMESVWGDFRFALRMIGKRPGLAIFAVITLALGIGANTATFSVVNAVLLRGLPYKDPDRLVAIKEQVPLIRSLSMTVCAADVPVFRKQNQAFESIAAFRFNQADFSGHGEPQRVLADRVEANLFSVLGVHPILGREFTPEEDRPGSHLVILSYGMWQSHFGGQADAIGQTVELDREPYTVIGVMPASFVFPLPGMNEGNVARMFVPMGFTADEMGDVGDNFSYGVIGRMKAGVNIKAASADLARIAAGILQTYPPQDRDAIQLTAAAFPLREQIVGAVETPLLLLFGAVGFVLLIACANVANLLLAHATNRQREFAVRMAMGAGRARLVRQLAVESAVLAAMGGAAGLGLAVWMTKIVAKLLPADIPRVHPVAVDGAVLAFTFGIAMFTGLAFGIVPALIASRIDLNVSMKEGGPSAGRGPRNRRMRAGLGVVEVALSVVLLVGSVLLMRSLFHVLETRSGFRPEHVTAASLYLPPKKYERDNQVRGFYRDLLERLKQSPGVTEAGASTDLPLEGGWNHVFTVEGGNPTVGGDLPIAFHSIILGDYLQTMGIRLLQGRYFSANDTASVPPVLIVSESLAKQYWPNESPLGKRLKWGPAASSDPWMTIVGVVSDVKQRALETATLPHTYEPYEQHKGAPSSLNIAIRTQTVPEMSAAELRDAVWGIDRQLAVAQLRTMGEVISESTSGRRFNFSVVGAFTVFAVLLTAIGVYGVIGCSVAERTHEIGIRMALGATHRDVVAKVIKEGLLLALGGIGIGLAMTLLLARIVAGLLYGIAATDPLTLTAVCVTIAGVCVAASYLPARRAMRVDPMVALRHE